MTHTITPLAAPEVPPCPSWCDKRHPIGREVHYSEPRVWADTITTDGEGLRVEMTVRRGDEHAAPWPDSIGQACLDFRIIGSPEMVTTDERRPVLQSWISANSLRDLGHWLLTIADGADPHDLDGNPIEWHTLQPVSHCGTQRSLGL